MAFHLLSVTYGDFCENFVVRISILFLSVFCQLSAVAADLSVPAEIRTLGAEHWFCC